MYTKDLFAYSMSFEKKVMSSLRSNSDMNDIESAYNQEEKKSKKRIRILVTFPTPCPSTKLPLKTKM